MLDRDLAELYGVETRTLNQAVSTTLAELQADKAKPVQRRRVGFRISGDKE